MTERSRSAVERAPARLRIGPSALYSSDGALHATIEELAMPVPRRVRGRISVTPTGQGMAGSLALDPAKRHRWWPVAPTARIEVEMERPRLAWRGHAYVDCNFGAAGLEEDFRSWHWSRSALSTGTAVLYGGELRDGHRFERAILFGHRKEPVAFEPPPAVAVAGLSRWGVAGWTRADNAAPPRLLRRLEDTPFYARALLTTRLLGETAPTIHESLSLERFSRSWVRLMLPFRMPRRVGP